MCREVEQICTRNFLFKCTNADFDIPINLDFKPDVIILRQVAYSVATSTDDIYQLYSDIIDDQILCVFSDGVSMSSPNTHFPTSNIRSTGVYNFQIQSVPAGSISITGPGKITTAANGTLGIILEFVKYKQCK
jgi:hypothetical protein